MRGFGWGCPNVHFVCHVLYKIVYAHLCDIHLVSSVMQIHLRPALMATSLGLVLICSVDIVVWKIPWSKENLSGIIPKWPCPFFESYCIWENFWISHFGRYNHDGYQNMSSWDRWIDSRAQFHSRFHWIPCYFRKYRKILKFCI